MNVGLFILKNGVSLVSESEQLDYEPSAHLIDPMTFSGESKLTLRTWPPQTEDTHILLRSEDLLTVCEPSERLLASYLKKTGKSLTDGEEEVILENEAPTPPQYGGMPDDDEYEPHYVEDPLI